MDSEGGGKIKIKKSRPQNKPYERRTSLFNRVKDSVRDILSPSWLVDIVSSVKRKSPDPQATIADDSDQDNEETYEPPPSTTQQTFTPATFQPNIMSTQRPNHQQYPVQLSTNRLGVDTPQTAFSQQQYKSSLNARTSQQTLVSRHVIQRNNRIVAPDVEETPVSGSRTGFGGTQLPFSAFKGRQLPTPMVNGDDNMSESSDISTATNSMVPQIDKREYQKEILKLDDKKLEQLSQDLQANEREMETLSETDASSASNSVQKQHSNRSLWSNDASRNKQQTTVGTRPSFSLSTFASSSFSERSSILGENYKESPFYSGKTTFGGASATRRNRLSAASPYQALPLRRQVKAKPLNSSTQVAGVTSSTAKRILETLEKMTTPLADAKRIPSNQSSLADSVLSFTPASYRRRPIFLSQSSSRTSSESTPLGAPPVNRLTTPRAASISRHRIVSPAKSSPSQDMQTSEIKESSQPTGVPARNSVSEPQLGKSGGKMKRDKHQHYSTKKQDEEEEVEAPELPTGVQLNVSSMPTFNFGSTPFGPKPTTSTDSGQNKSLPFASFKTTANKEAMNTSSDSAQFKFSSPITKTMSTESLNVPVLVSISKEFTFSSPLNAVSTARPKKQQSEPVTFVGGLKPAVELKTGSVMNFLGKKEEASTVSSGFQFGAFKPAAELKTGSAMDISGAKKKEEASTVSSGFQFGAFKPAAQLKTGSVMDILGAKKKETTSTPQLKTGSVMDILGSKTDTPTATGSVNFTAAFKKPAGNWDCPTCLIQNSASNTKCVACETLKPTAKAADTSINFADKFKPDAGSWECDACLVRNKPEVLKCVACQSEKPKVNTAGKPVSNFMSAFKSNTGKWECETCLIQNEPNVEKCVACGTSNPKAKSTCTNSGISSLNNVFKAPNEQWECPTCMIQNKNEDIKCVACQTSKPGIKSGSSSIPLFGAGTPIGSFGDKFKTKSGDWECDACLVRNKEKDEKCVACGAANPTPVAKKKVTKPAGPWECDTCLVQNKGEVTRCVACETPKPGTENASFKSLPVSASSIASGGGFVFSASSKNTSSTGFMSSSFVGSNDSSKCGTGFQFKPPSSQSDDSSTTSSGFQLKAAEKGSTDSSNSGFQFTKNTEVKKDESNKPSASSQSDDGSTISSGFQFKAAEKSKTDSSSSGFQFTKTAEVKKEESNKTDSLFQFKPASEKEETSSMPSGFKFGALSSNSTANTDDKKYEANTVEDKNSISFKPVFTNQKTDVPSLNSANLHSDNGKPKPGSAFSFGSSASQQTGSKDPEKFKITSFVVGGQNTEEATKAAFGMSSFSSANSFPALQAAATDAPTFGEKPCETTKTATSLFNFSGQTQPNTTLNFGKTTDQTALSSDPAVPAEQAKSTVNFGQTSTAATFNFNKTTELSGIKASETPKTTFNFGQMPQVSDMSSKPAEPSKAVFTFGTNATQQKSTAPSSAGASLFAFGSAANEQKTGVGLGFGQGKSDGILSGKRSLESDSEPTAKKPVGAPVFGGFGSSNNIPYASINVTANSSFGNQASTAAFGTGTGPFASSSSTFPGFGAPVTSSTVPLTFGASVTTRPTAFGTTTTTSPTPSIFGGSIQSGTTFGSQTSATPFGAPTGPVFGTNVAPAFGTCTTASPAFSATPNFGFTGNNTAPASGVFAFGATQAQTSSPGGFNFPSMGGTQNFTQGSSANFGATPDASNPFSVSSSGTSQRRTIKKATRKLNRK